MNPYEGWVPYVPDGVVLEPLSSDYLHVEQLGESCLGKCGFVLVAGGLGERLGFSGIKISLPTDNITRTSYIELYCKSILTIQEKFAPEGHLVPLAIMVSGDTESATLELFTQKNYFGLSHQQISFMKQEEVAALLDNNARIATVEDSKYSVITKPHGHGDVHSLMYSSGVAENWHKMGIEWCYFFQDTNALAFKSLPSMLGVSSIKKYDMNSMAVARKAKQAVGGIARLVRGNSSLELNQVSGPFEMTINVEYNQLDPLLRGSGHTDGDVNDPLTGYSPYPGNINELLFYFPAYIRVLNATHGVVGEFVNPKYADASKEKFVKPTRLECMMQVVYYISCCITF